jgi:hypothetical protein
MDICIFDVYLLAPITYPGGEHTTSPIREWEGQGGAILFFFRPIYIYIDLASIIALVVLVEQNDCGNAQGTDDPLSGEERVLRDGHEQVHGYEPDHDPLQARGVVVRDLRSQHVQQLSDDAESAVEQLHSVLHLQVGAQVVVRLHELVIVLIIVSCIGVVSVVI